MKKIIVIIGVMVGILSANQIIGNAGDTLRGFAPEDTLIININASLLIPARIGLHVDADIGWDLSSPAPGSPSPQYPPSLYPGYYYPNTASLVNPEGVLVLVFSNSQAYTWYLEINGSGDFSGTVALNQVLVAPDGTQPPQEGNPPTPPWLSLSTDYQELNSGQKTNGWADYSKDFLFMAEPDDEPVNNVITVSFRLYAQ